MKPAQENRDLSSCVIVINPSRFPFQVKRLKKMLSTYYIPNLIETESKAHFLETVRDFARGNRRYLLVWGGDGTAHDAINVLYKKERGPTKSVGFLRGGSGNGIQDSYEVPFLLRRQIKTYAESIRRGYTVDVDLLRVKNGGGSEYGQLVGLGFDARLLTRREGRRSRRTGTTKAGFLNYLLSGVQTYLSEPLSDGRVYTARLEDGKYALRGTRINAEFPFSKLDLDIQAPMIEIGTRPYYGLLFKVCPDVVCNDGFMDLYLFNFQSKLDIALHLPALWNGRHPRINSGFAKKEKPIIERFEIRRMRVESDQPIPYHIDGELRTCSVKHKGVYTLRLEVLPAGISFLVPEVFYRKFHPF
jgi:diacylglycerol kinase family enzyme